MWQQRSNDRQSHCYSRTVWTVVYTEAFYYLLPIYYEMIYVSLHIVMWLTCYSEHPHLQQTHSEGANLQSRRSESLVFANCFHPPARPCHFVSAPQTAHRRRPRQKIDPRNGSWRKAGREDLWVGNSVASGTEWETVVRSLGWWVTAVSFDEESNMSGGKKKTLKEIKRNDSQVRTWDEVIHKETHRTTHRSSGRRRGIQENQRPSRSM